MPEQDTTRSDLPAIRAVIDAIIKAVRTGDVESFLRHCAPEIVVFDLTAPLEHEGWDAVRRGWSMALAPFEGPVEYDIDHLNVAISGDTAFSHCLAQFGGTTKDGRHVMSRLRTTLGFRKMGSEWKVIHQHVSVPFDMANGQALLNLEA
jgi:uncharacterized protein (TIGR02246 family)